MNMERRVSRVTAAREPPEGVRQDVDIIGAVADRVVPELFDSTRLDPEALFDEVAALTRGTTADISGISYDRLSEELAVRWPAPDAGTNAGYRYDDDGEWSFPTPSGRARFAGGTGRDPPEPPDAEYPLTLTTARAADGYNTGIRSRDGDGGDPVARIHPDSVAAHEGRIDGGRVTITSRRGRVTVRVDADESVPRGVVWLPIHHPATNRLTLPDRDPQSKEPHFKGCAVRLVAPGTELTTGEAERPAVEPPRNR
jgi:assimilatory nitrate reductase catalytic subunit